MSFKYFFEIISYFKDMRANSILKSRVTPGLALSAQDKSEVTAFWGLRKSHNFNS